MVASRAQQVEPNDPDDEALLAARLQALGDAVPSAGDVALARARVRERLQARMQAWRSTPPGLTLTSHRD